jgi:glutathione S-transferase
LSTRNRALYDQSISFLITEIDAQALWIHRKHADLGKVFGFIPDVVQAAKKQFDRANKVMIDQLNPFLLGPDFSAADIVYVHCLTWAQAIGWDDGCKENDKIKCYLHLCQTREGFQKVWQVREFEEQARAKYIKDKEEPSRDPNSKL